MKGGHLLILQPMMRQAYRATTRSVDTGLLDTSGSPPLRESAPQRSKNPATSQYPSADSQPRPSTQRLWNNDSGFIDSPWFPVKHPWKRLSSIWCWIDNG
ncbi:MAG: hypothetical protein ACO318_03980, partial [Pontimonas sp.]